MRRTTDSALGHKRLLVEPDIAIGIDQSRMSHFHKGDGYEL